MRSVAAIVAAALAATLTAVAPTSAGARPADPVQRFRQEASRPALVVLGEGGGAAFIGSATGRPLIPADPDASAGETATAFVADHAELLGVDGTRVTVTSTRASVTGGRVVRLGQVVDGVPVLGGEVVVTLAEDGGVTSAQAEVADVADLPARQVTEGAAAATARAAVAKAVGVRADALTVRRDGAWAYDPALLGTTGPEGARPAWRFEVTDGAAVRQLVLVDAVTGRTLLRVDRVAQALDRLVCDAGNATPASDDCLAAPAPARTETGPGSEVAEVNDAFTLTGAAAAMYAEVAGLDLTATIGAGSAVRRRLASWVRYCPAEDGTGTGPSCPMPNAFWSGRQMFFGAGFAGADDVVGHELTHGVIEQRSDLFYFHQSGAINESIADVMGEILDHRHPSPGDSPGDWRLGEDLPIGAIRDLANPTAFGQPDRMTSPLYDADPDLRDQGGVHTNSGVGNKTAYLISQGGTFRGVTVRGIDAGDPTLTKTARLYVEVATRLTSGSQYADLARVLGQSCAELAATGTAGFTAEDCTSVAAATTATELTRAPTVPGAAPAPAAPTTCPAGTDKQVLWTNTGTTAGMLVSRRGLWFDAPSAAYGIPRNARTGTDSLFGGDPDPSLGTPSFASVLMRDPVALPAGQRSFLAFDQWRLFESAPGLFFDGGTVGLQSLDEAGDGRDESLPASAWVNGPSDPLAATSVPAFGGDSHGWTTSRLELTALAGRTVRVSWSVQGDADGSFLGWYLDNLSVYTCVPGPTPPQDPPGIPTGLVVSPRQGPAAVLSWRPPAQVGGGVVGYRIRRSDGRVATVGAATLGTTMTGLAAGTTYTFAVSALGAGGAEGPPVGARVRGTRLSVRPTARKVAAGATVGFTGRVRPADAGDLLLHPALVLQGRLPGRAWHRVASPLRVRADGRYTVATTVRRTRAYRIVFAPRPGWFGAQSAAVTVKARR